MNKFLESEWAIIIAGILMCILVIFGLGYCMEQNERHKERPEVFSAWQHANPGQTITYDEWKVLRRSKVLPGQTEEKTTVITVPIHH